MHVRQQIRDAIATTVTGLSTTGSRVYVGRVSAMAAGNLPGLVLTTPKETVRMVDREATQMRDLEVMVDACVASSDSAIGTLDTICSEVETALGASVTVGGESYEIVVAETKTELKAESDPTLAIAHLKLLVTYQTNQGSPDTPV